MTKWLFSKIHQATRRLRTGPLVYCTINSPRKRAAVGFGFAVEPLPVMLTLDGQIFFQPAEGMDVSGINFRTK